MKIILKRRRNVVVIERHPYNRSWEESDQYPGKSRWSLLSKAMLKTTTAFPLFNYLNILWVFSLLCSLYPGTLLRRHEGQYVTDSYVRYFVKSNPSSFLNSDLFPIIRTRLVRMVTLCQGKKLSVPQILGKSTAVRPAELFHICCHCRRRNRTSPQLVGTTCQFSFPTPYTT